MNFENQVHKDRSQFNKLNWRSFLKLEENCPFLFIHFGETQNSNTKKFKSATYPSNLPLKKNL